LVGRDLEAGFAQVAIEDHVQVLVGRDPGHQLVGDRLAAGLAGVAVRDPGRQLLEGDIKDRVEDALGEQVILDLLDLLVLAGAEAAGQRLHPQRLQLHRVDVAGGDEKVAQRDAVPVLLGGPAVDPGAPRGVHGEVHRDLAVIGGQVVLGQQVLQHRHPGDLGQLGLLGIPVLAVERVVVLPLRPGNVVVRVPVFGHAEVPVKTGLDDGLELLQQLQVSQALCHGPSQVSVSASCTQYICVCRYQQVAAPPFRSRFSNLRPC
jgi:hypothetical protein